MEIQAFWPAGRLKAAPCTSICVLQRFGGTLCMRPFVWVSGSTPIRQRGRSP